MKPSPRLAVALTYVAAWLWCAALCVCDVIIVAILTSVFMGDVLNASTSMLIVLYACVVPMGLTFDAVRKLARKNLNLDLFA